MGPLNQSEKVSDCEECYKLGFSNDGGGSKLEGGAPNSKYIKESSSNKVIKDGKDISTTEGFSEDQTTFIIETEEKNSESEDKITEF